MSSSDNHPVTHSQRYHYRVCSFTYTRVAPNIIIYTVQPYRDFRRSLCRTLFRRQPCSHSHAAGIFVTKIIISVGCRQWPKRIDAVAGFPCIVPIQNNRRYIL